MGRSGSPCSTEGMRRLGLCLGIVSSIAWPWLLASSGSLYLSADELAGEVGVAGRPAPWDGVLRAASSFLVLLSFATAGVMAATLVVSVARRRAPGASKAMQVLSVVVLFAGAAAGSARAWEGEWGALGPLLVVSSVPAAVVLALRSRVPERWPPGLMALMVTLGVVGGFWAGQTAQALDERAVATARQRLQKEQSRRARMRLAEHSTPRCMYEVVRP